jgi:hypothetical protein
VAIQSSFMDLLEPVTPAQPLPRLRPGEGGVAPQTVTPTPVNPPAALPSIAPQEPAPTQAAAVVNPPKPVKLDDLLEPVNPLELAHGTAPEAPPAPGTNPLAVAHGTDTVPPGQAFQMPDPIGSGAKGIADAIDELGQSVIARNRGSFDEAANQPPPEDWNIHPEDFLDVTKLTNKLSYGLTHSSPTLGAAALGGIAGSPFGIAGSAVGAGVSAGLAQMLQSLGPHYKAALAQGMDPDAAFDDAVKNSAQDSAFTAVGFAAFGFAPFKSFFKDVLFQAFGVQQVVGAAETAVKGFEDGKSWDEIGPDIVKQAPGLAFMTAVPASLMHVVMQPPAAPPRQARAGAAAGGPQPNAGASAGAGPQPNAGGPQPGAGAAGAGAAGAGAGPRPGAGGAGGAGAGAGAGPRPGAGGGQQRQAPPNWTDFMRQRAERAASANRPPDPATAGPYDADAWVNAASQALGGVPDANRASMTAFYEGILRRKGWSPADAKAMVARVVAGAPKAPPGPQSSAGSTYTSPGASKPPGYDQNPQAASAAASARNAEAGRNAEFEDIPEGPNAGPPNPPAGPGDAADLSTRQGGSTAPLRGGANEAPLSAAPPTDLGGGAAPQTPPNAATSPLVRPVQPQSTQSPLSTPPTTGLGTLSDLVEPVVGTGTRDDRVVVTHADDIDRAGAVVAQPTEAQAEAGNYQKGHVTIPGLEGYPVSIETAREGTRSGVGADGTRWSVMMPAAYGYIRRTKGADGDPLDVFLGPNPASGKAFVITQNTPDGKFDELKAVLGARTEAEARDLYLRSFAGGHGAKIFDSIHELSLPEFKEFLQKKTRARYPFLYDMRRRDLTDTQVARERGIAARRQRVRAKETPTDIIRAIQAAGGIKDDGKAAGRGDLRAMGAYSRPGLINNQSGQTLDYMREYLAQLGYFDHLYGSPAEASGRSSVADLTDLIDRGLRGDKVIPPDQQSLAQGQTDKAAEAKARDAVEREIDEVLGGTPSAKDAEYLQRVGDLMMAGDDIETAIERAAQQVIDEERLPPDDLAAIKEAGNIPGWDDDQDHAGTVPAVGAQGGATRPQEGGGPPAVGGGGEAQTGQKELRDRLERALENPKLNDNARRMIMRQLMDLEAKAPTTERTDAGEQGVLPGAEKIGQGEQAQRGADKPLKPKVAQQPADEGIFGDSSQQTDLVDMAKRPAPKGETDVGSDVQGERGRGAGEGEPASPGVADAGADRPGAVELPAGEIPGAVPSALPAGIEPFVKRLLDKGFSNVIAARKALQEFGWKAPDENTPVGKQMDEAIEFAVVLAARKIVAGGKTPAETFKALVDLYENKQPKLGVRTGKSMAEQAYSTPAPLAYVASRLAYADDGRSVFEPTAGNGMLLVATSPKRTTANEIDPTRAAALKAQGFRVTQRDATQEHAGSAVRQWGAVIANPPFGTVREGGTVKIFEVDGWKTRNIDHAIALQALSTMKEDGHAVLIVAGTGGREKGEAVTREGARKQGYNTQAQREFNVRLYRDYNVVDRFTVNGDLYAKQGAQWPVDVIVIHGRGKSALPLPGSVLPPMFDTWEALEAKVNADGRSSENAAQPAGSRGTPPGRPVEGLDRPQGGNGRGGIPAGGRRPVGGDTAAQPDAGPVRDGDHPEQPADAGKPAEPAARVEPAGAGDGGRPDKLPDAERRPRVTNEAGQTTYRPKSKNPDFNSLVPANQADAVQSALKRVADAHGGDIDKWVAKELGYNSNELGAYFSGEQVDALALAIHAHEGGSAIVLGDQTGVGKGRVMAGMARYARKQGLIPVLFTEKPDLYGDLYRDLRDIGMPDARMVMTNTGTAVPMDEEAIDWKAEMDEALANRTKRPARRGLFLRNPDVEVAYDKLRRIAAGEDLADIVFTTYDQTNSVQGKDTARRAILKAMAPKAMLLMDESHNAGGQGQEKWKAKDKPVNRAEFARQLVSDAAGVIYSSATWAKRPQVMDLYRRTDMGKAVEKPEMLPAIIEKGGVPLQQIVSSMLASSGQYIRRERSFDGIEYTPVLTPIDTKTYGSFTAAVKAIYQFDRSIGGKEGERAKLMEAHLASIGSAMVRDNAIGDAGAHSTEFSSIMHNLVGQMLLSIQAKPIADLAIASWKAGEKPSIALSNTMETFLNDYADANGLEVGAPVDINFGHLLQRYLERTLRITIKDADGKVSHHQFKPSDLSPEAQARYEQAAAELGSGDYAGMPVSPIDAMREAMEAAGMKVAEITGRHFIIKNGKLAHRPKAEMGAGGKRVTVRKYNNGQYDGLIFNKSGSTGISMHAKADNDGRPRHMFIAQADGNIDTFMQTLGRINRTGQIVLPRYTQSVPDVPAAVRPAAVLLKKMASLNANTTAARGSIFNAKTSVDFVNQYGDMVAEKILGEDYALNYELGGILKLDDEDQKPDEGADLIRKLTGRLVLLTPERQQEVIDRIQADYEALIKNLDALGENLLEAKTLELDAKTIDRTEIKPATGDNDFLAPVYLERIDIKSPGRAMAPQEVVDRVQDTLTGVDVGKGGDLSARLVRLAEAATRVYAERLRGAASAYTKWKHDNLNGIKNLNGRKKAIEEADANFARFQALTRMLTPGKVVQLTSKNGDMPAVVLELRRPGKAKNPVALGSWAVSLAIPDSGREVQFNLTTIRPRFQGDEEKVPDGEVAVARSDLDPQPVFDMFDEARKEGREKRLMVTGNILAGFDLAKGHGQIVNYKTSDGEIRPGIFVPRSTTHDDFMQLTAVRLAPNQVTAFLDKARQGRVTSIDGYVAIYREGGGFNIDIAAAREKGGRYFLEQKVRDAVGDRFVKTKTREGQRMQAANLQPAQVERAVREMSNLGAVFETAEHQNIAREVVKANPAPKAAGSPKRSASVATRARQTDTPAFRAWFGDSKVVDGEGNPQVVFHGTAESFDRFKTRQQPRGFGIYFGGHPDIGSWFGSTPEVADSFAREPDKGIVFEDLPASQRAFKDGGNIMPAFLSLQSPKVYATYSAFDKDSEAYRSGKGMRNALERQGYDGIIIVRSATDGGGERSDYVAFKPEQIKSATGNSGRFDPNNPDIRASRADAVAPFYSAVLRAVEASKTAKASPEQWLATVKNAPGIKTEEIEWIGLEDWLKGQTGALTREAVADFVRANQIEVNDRVLGGDAEIDVVHGSVDTENSQNLQEVAVMRGDEEVGSYVFTWEDGGVWSIDRADGSSVDSGTLRNMPDQAQVSAIVRQDFVDSEPGWDRVDGGGTQFDQYQLPGGENYRELLLTLPTREPVGYRFETNPNDGPNGRTHVYDPEGRHLGTWPTREAAIASQRRQTGADNFTEGHFRATPNVLAHVRFNDREVPIPFTADEKAQIAAHDAWAAQRDMLDVDRREPTRKLLDEGKARDKARRDALNARLKAGTITAGQWREEVERFEDRPDNETTRAYDAADAAYWAHVKAEPPTPEPRKERVLFIEEIQSDWHAQARKRGIAAAEDDAFKERIATARKALLAALRKDDNLGFDDAELARAEIMRNPNWRRDFPDVSPETVAAAEAYLPLQQRHMANQHGVPDAPFIKTNWHELAFKRMVRWAAENGYDRLAWTPAIEQVKRYEAPLRERVKSIAWDDGGDIGTHFRYVDILPHNSAGFTRLKLTMSADGLIESAYRGEKQVEELDGKPIEDLVGKEIARRIIEEPRGKVEGENLTIGGKGYSDLYDKALVKFADKIGKRFGAKVEPVQISAAGGKPTASADFHDHVTKQKAPITAHSLPITDAMRDSVMQGQVLFARRPVEKGNMVFPDQPDGTAFIRGHNPEDYSTAEVAIAGTNSPAERIINELQSIVSRLIGARVPIIFYDTIRLATHAYDHELAAAARAAGTTMEPTVGGYHETQPGMPGTTVIGIAVGDPRYDPRLTARHEPAHEIYTYLLNDRERAIVAKDAKRGAGSTMRRYAAQFFQRDPGDPFVAQVPEEELFAHGYSIYDAKATKGEDPGRGLHIALRRIYDKLRRMFQTVRRWLTRRDIHSVDDIYRAMFEGQMVARREGLMAVAEAVGQKSPYENRQASPMAPAPARSAARRPRPQGPSRTPAANAWYSRADSLLGRLGLRSDAARRLTQNRFIFMRRLQQEIERDVGPLNTDLDAYMAARLYVGRAGSRHTDLREQVVDPLIDRMKELGVDRESLDEYLYAVEALDRNQLIRAIDPANQAGSGMTDADAQAIINAVRNGPQATAFADLAQRVWDLNNATRQQLVRDGLLDQATANEWQRDHPHYVPLRGWENNDDEELTDGPRSGKGFDVRGPESHRALGRRSRADSPLAYSIMQAEQAITRAEKNRVLLHLRRLVLAYPEPDLWQMTRGSRARFVNPRTGLVSYRFRPMGNYPHDEYFAVKMGGRTAWIHIKDPSLRRALRGVGSSAFDVPLIQYALRAARLWAAMRTQYSLEFGVVNKVRDVEEALLNLADTPGGRSKYLAVVRRAMSPIAIRAIWRSLRHPTRAPNSATQRWYEEFRHAGGEISVLQWNDVATIKRQIEADMNAGRIRNGFRAIGQLVTDYNTAIENSTRLSVYIALREAGVDMDKAALAAREITVDFNLHGEWGPALNLAYVFYNAGIQGTARVARGIRYNRGVQAMVLGLIALGAGMDGLNAWMSEDDEKTGKKKYDTIPDHEKQRSLVIMIPGSKDGVHITLPFAFTYGLFIEIGRNMSALARGAIDPGRAIANIFAAGRSAIDPIGSGSADFLQWITPTVLDPLAEISENRDYLGNPIAPTKFDNLKPDSENAFGSTPQIYKDAARYLNSATGGNPGKKGAVDISPETLQHLYGFLTGGVGRDVQNVISTGYKAYTGAEVPPSGVPIVRRFLATTTSTPVLKSEFYLAYDKLAAIHHEYEAARHANDSAWVNRITTDHQADLNRYQSLEQLRQRLSKNAQEKSHAKTLAQSNKLDEDARQIMLAAKQYYPPQ